MDEKQLKNMHNALIRKTKAKISRGESVNRDMVRLMDDINYFYDKVKNVAAEKGYNLATSDGRGKIVREISRHAYEMGSVKRVKSAYDQVQLQVSKLENFVKNESNPIEQRQKAAQFLQDFKQQYESDLRPRSEKDIEDTVRFNKENLFFRGTRNIPEEQKGVFNHMFDYLNMAWFSINGTGFFWDSPKA